MTETLSTTVVSILGDRYPIKSDADPAYLHELARYVEERIRSVESRAKLPVHLKAEVLAAILIADDYFSEKKKNATVNQRLFDLSDMLEAVVPDTATEAEQETTPF